MSLDLLLCPNEDAAPLTVEQIRDRFTSAGLPCTIETQDGPWIHFDDYESDLVFTVEADRASSVVMQAVSGDDPEFGERVFTIFESFGWCYVEGTF